MTSNIGRGRFFAYSLALFVVEAVAVVLCIAATLGFDGLANSKPGPSRQGLALAILLVSLVFVVLRTNFAWRRSRDANGSKWILGGYVFFSAIFAFLQAATLLVYKFDGGSSSTGLNLLGLGIVGFWFVILCARPVGGSSGSAAYAGLGDSVSREPRTMDPDANASPVTVAPAVQRRAQVRRTTFGKRGLA